MGIRDKLREKKKQTESKKSPSSKKKTSSEKTKGEEVPDFQQLRSEPEREDTSGKSLAEKTKEARERAKSQTGKILWTFKPINMDTKVGCSTSHLGREQEAREVLRCYMGTNISKTAYLIDVQAK